MKIYVSDKETGTIIEEVASIEDGRKLIFDFEETDRKKGNYTPCFYDIVNDKKISLIYN